MSGYKKIQQKLKDLESKIASEKEPQQQVDLLNSLSRELFVYEVDRSIQYARDARKLATGIHYDRALLCH